MAVIKVVASLFSSIKTVGRALEKMAVGDEIFVSSGNYKETITFLHDVCITGNNRLDTVIEGNLIIPKSSHVQLKNLTIKPSVQIYIEGTLELAYWRQPSEPKQKQTCLVNRLYCVVVFAHLCRQVLKHLLKPDTIPEMHILNVFMK